jgi:protocatechuate 3,4-dioxygenase beta subunit
MFKDDPEHQRIDILGTVTNVDGSPASNAIVVIRNGSAMGSGPGRKINCLLARTRTDDDGKYKFNQVAVSQPRIRPQIIAVTESGEMGWRSIVQAKNMKVAKTINVQLEATSDLGGRLVDDQQNPIVGAQITLRLLARMRDTGRSLEQVGFNDRVIAPQTTTDDDGNFVFKGFPTNAAFRFGFKHSEFPLTLHSLSQSDKVIESAKSWGPRKQVVMKSGAQISMDQGIEITGKVISQGKPVVGALVSYMYSSRCFGTSDDNGDFKFVVSPGWLEVEHDDYHLRISHNDFARTRINFSSEQLKSEKLRIVLQSPATVSGKVQSESNAMPIAKARLSVSDSVGNGMHLSTNDNGEFKFKIAPGKVTVELFAAKGGYHVQREKSEVTQGNSSAMVKGFTVKPGEVKQLDPFLLKQLFTIEVKVVNEDGDPVSGATTKLISPGEHANYNENSDEATTDMDGSAMLIPWNKPTPGTLVAATFTQDGQTMIGESFVEEDSDVTNIKILPAAAARGKVTLNGKPLAGVPLSLRISVPKNPFPHLHPSRSISRQLAFALTDKDGEYSVDVPQVDANGNPASILVSVRPRHNSTIPNVDAGGIGNRMNLAGLVYSRDIEFFEGQGEILGRVVDEGGKGLVGIGVYIAQGFGKDRNLKFRLFQPSKVYTDQNGQFHFRGLPKDKSYEIRTSKRDPLDYQKTYTQDLINVKPGQKDIVLKIRRVESEK